MLHDIIHAAVTPWLQSHQHGGCWCPATYLVPGHLQPSWWCRQVSLPPPPPLPPTWWGTAPGYWPIAYQSILFIELTHWPLRDVEVILQDYFSNSFCKFIFWTNPVNLVSCECHRTPLISLYWFPVMACCCQAESHYLSQCWPRYMSSLGHNELITRDSWPWVTEIAVMKSYLRTCFLLSLFILSFSCYDSNGKCVHDLNFSLQNTE